MIFTCVVVFVKSSSGTTGTSELTRFSLAFVALELEPPSKEDFTKHDIIKGEINLLKTEGQVKMTHYPSYWSEISKLLQ